MQLTKEIKKDFKSDLKVAKKLRLPWWGVLCVIIASILIGLPLALLGRFDLARPILFSIGMLGVTIAIKWNLRRNAWFWIVITLIAAFHVALILSLTWTTRWVPAVALVPFGIADVYAMLALVDVVEVRLQRREKRKILPQT